MKLIETAVKLGHVIKFKAIQNEDKLWYVAGASFLSAALFSSAKAGRKYEEILRKHNEELARQKEAERLVESGEVDDTITDVQKKADRRSIYIHTIVETAKAAAPTVGLAFASLICFRQGQCVLQGRYLSMAAAYSAVLKDKIHLEDMIRKKDGQETLDKMKEGEKEQVIDYNTGESYEQLKDGQQANYDAYAKFFDESNPNWEKNPEHNRHFLHGKENYADYLLKKRGYLFLNEVYDMLDLPLTQAGQVIGWIYYKDEKEAAFHGAANKVLFGILDGDTQSGRDFVNGYERSILLKFNVDPEPIIGYVGFAEV